MKPFVLAVVALVTIFSGCANQSEPERHYQLTGRVVALNPKDQTALIHAAAIPGWMEAMTMEYPVRSKSEFNALHAGEEITATVNVRSDGEYALSNVRSKGSSKQE